MSISLNKENAIKKAEQKAPNMVSLIKQASVSLDKKNLNSDVFRVVLALDISASMRNQYSTGKVQKLVERALALGANLDDNGEVEVYLFGVNAKQAETISLDNITGAVNRMRFEFEGGTNYAPVIEKIKTDALKESTPTLVLFITDGDNSDHDRARKQMIEASKYPIFWKFMAISNKSAKSGGFFGLFGGDSDYEEGFNFLKQLDTMSGRTVDNANFFAVDKDVSLSDEQLFDKLVEEIDDWKKLQKRNLLLPCKQVSEVKMKPLEILKEVLKNYTPEQLEEALKGKGPPTGITVGEYISAMKDFEINRYEISGESFVVCTGISGINPFSSLSEVRKEYFKKYSEPTMLFFDLYATNGDKDNRFAKMFLGDEGFISETFSIVKAEELPIKLLEIQNARIQK